MPETPPRPPKVFISYRRDDHPEIAAILHGRFGMRYGKENVFRDVPGIAAGAEFQRDIPRRIKTCDVLVTLIGPEWVRLIQKKAIDEVDYVRTEIATALAEKKLVVPVLICGAAKPVREEIHFLVRELVDRNWKELRDPVNNEIEVEALIESIDQGFAQWDGMREEVERMEEVPPAAGLALGYFVNFIRDAVPKIAELNAEGSAYRHAIEIAERSGGPAIHTFGNALNSRDDLKLHIVIPPSLNYLLPERLKPVQQRLHQASISGGGLPRPFAIDAWRDGERFQLIDFPRTLGVLNTWLRRHLAKPPREPDSAEWRELEAEEIWRFESILKWWVEDPGNGPGFRDRVRLIRYTGEEVELRWLREFWRPRGA